VAHLHAYQIKIQRLEYCVKLTATDKKNKIQRLYSSENNIYNTDICINIVHKQLYIFRRSIIISVRLSIFILYMSSLKTLKLNNIYEYIIYFKIKHKAKYIYHYSIYFKNIFHSCLRLGYTFKKCYVNSIHFIRSYIFLLQIKTLIQPKHFCAYYFLFYN